MYAEAEMFALLIDKSFEIILKKNTIKLKLFFASKILFDLFILVLFEHFLEVIINKKWIKYLKLTVCH